MASSAPSLRPLACAGCGANLRTTPATAGGGELACDDCGKRHVHEHPPPDAINEALTVGQPVLVEAGGCWWPATVIADSGPRRWRVRFDGWTEAWDREVGPEQVRPRPLAPRPNPSDNGFMGIMLGIVVATGVALAVVIIALGHVITASETGQSPQPATVRPPPQEPSPAEAGHTLPGPIANPSQIRIGPETPLEVGQPIHVRWRGDWYQARIAGLNADGSVSVDYVGWPDRYDQPRVQRSRIRLP